jgi:hypothetical protein
MSHAAGDEVWSMTTHVAYDGIARAHVLKVKVAGVIDGVTVVRMPSGSITALREMGGLLFDSEPDAWAAAARELAEARDRVQTAIDEATAKAAGSRVGEAVAT